MPAHNKRRMPAEWAEQDWIWIGFPHADEEWPGVLEKAQQQIAAFASAVAESGQAVRLIARDPANAKRAQSLVSGKVAIQIQEYGDIWLRDTGPLIVNENGRRSARRFAFNGWGGKYLMPGDQTIGETLAQDAGFPVNFSDWILEGGALDTDGTGLVVTTEQCLLNPNRNPQMDKEAIEARLQSDLGFDRVLWLKNGLINDHTDGHVDNLVRFVAPNTLAVPVATGRDDPNAAIYDDARQRARQFGVGITDIASPGRIESNGQIEPASYANFAITSRLVVVPVFGSPHDDDGVASVAAQFPDRDTIGLPADAVLAGGGSFHCASQHCPSAP